MKRFQFMRLFSGIAHYQHIKEMRALGEKCIFKDLNSLKGQLKQLSKAKEQGKELGKELKIIYEGQAVAVKDVDTSSLKDKQFGTVHLADGTSFTAEKVVMDPHYEWVWPVAGSGKAGPSGK